MELLLLSNSMNFGDAAHAERHDRRAVLRADLADGADFIGRDREHHGVGHAGGVPRLAVRVVLTNGLRRRHPFAKEAS